MKKRNKEFWKEKQLIRLRQKDQEISDAIRNQGLVELEVPVHHGYNAEWVLRADILRRDDAAAYQEALDDIRKELGIKPTDKKGNGTVIQLAKERAKEFMRKKQPFVWNATNITAQLRMQLISLFESYGGRVTIIYIEVPYKTLISQNANREMAVPQNVIERMISKLEPPQMDEAYNVINVVE